MLPFGLNTAPQVFARLGHTVTGYLHRQGISVIPYLDDWLIHHPDRQVLLPTSGSAHKHAGPSRLYPKQKEIQAGPDSGSTVSQNPFTSGLRGSFPSRVQSLGDNYTCSPSILPPSTNLFSSVPAYGVTQLGLRSYPSGSFVPETSSTSFSLIISDRRVYATASIRHWSLPTFYSTLWGAHMGDSQILGNLNPYKPQAPYQLSGAQGGSLCPTALGPSAPGPPGYDRYGQFNSSFVYQQARRDPFPHLVTFDSRASPLVRGSEHNGPSKTYSRLSERDSRPPISSESANIDRVVPPPQDCETHLQVLGNPRSRHVCNSVELPSSSVHVSNSRAKSPSSGCSVSGLAGEVNVHVFAIPSAQQSHSEAPVHPGGRGNSHSPLVANSVMVSTPTSPLCGTPPGLSLPSRSSVQTGSEVCLGRKVVPSACMDALMRHYKAAGFPDEVSRQPLGGPQPIACTTIGGFASLDGRRARV